MSPQERQQLQLANARERKATAALERQQKKNLELKTQLEAVREEITVLKAEVSLLNLMKVEYNLLMAEAHKAAPAPEPVRRTRKTKRKEVADDLSD